jgi:ABC-2 type transport system permease protein
LRVLGVGWLLHLKMLTRSAFDGILGVVWPLFFATVAFFMFRAGGDPDSLIYAGLGASVMGVWSSTSTSAGSALQRERWDGTLELLVAAPTRFPLVVLPITVAMSTVGLYSMAATLLYGRFVFGIDVTIDQPALFLLAIPATVISIGALGFLMSVTVVRYRTAWALGSSLEQPVWLVCGFLVPLPLLPDWVHPIAWGLAPTWGMDALRESATGGSPLPELLVCVGLAVAYGAVGFLLAETVLRSARATASLSLT